jgi:integrase
MAHNRLSTRTVEAKLKRGRYGDGGGLFLQVSKWETKSWVFRWERDGRERHMGLGAAHTLSLAEARERARECRRQLLDGHDPIEARNSERARQRVESARKATFRECAEQYLEAHRAGWGSTKHALQWQSTLAIYAYPIIGELPVAAVDTALVVRCIEPIWRTKPETAKRLRARIESVLDSATVRGFRYGDNPARWRGHLNKLLPAPSKVRAVKHLAAIPYLDLPAFLTELRLRSGHGARAVEFTILTAVRSGETLGARWAEIDLTTKTWTIPARRMKAKREHRVPLSPRATEILDDLPRVGEHVFPGTKAGRPLSQLAMLATLRRLGRSDLTVHGFRSTFRDWAAETTAYPNHVVEMALAHAIGDQVEAAYRRGDLFEKRRRLMNEWAKYCERHGAGAAGVGNVAVLRGAT